MSAAAIIYYGSEGPLSLSLLTSLSVTHTHFLILLLPHSLPHAEFEQEREESAVQLIKALAVATGSSESVANAAAQTAAAVKEKIASGATGSEQPFVSIFVHETESKLPSAPTISLDASLDALPPTAVVRTVNMDDGHTVQYLHDGTKVDRFVDGTILEHRPDGSSVLATLQPNGMRCIIETGVDGVSRSQMQSVGDDLPDVASGSVAALATAPLPPPPAVSTSAPSVAPAAAPSTKAAAAPKTPMPATVAAMPSSAPPAVLPPPPPPATMGALPAAAPGMPGAPGGAAPKAMPPMPMPSAPSAVSVHTARSGSVFIQRK